MNTETEKNMMDNLHDAENIIYDETEEEKIREEWWKQILADREWIEMMEAKIKEKEEAENDS